MRNSKKNFLYSMSCILLLASLAWSQTGQPPISTTQLILPVFETNIAPATQANAARVGNPGPQTIYYWMVTNFTLGSSSPVGPFSVINAPNTLSSGNYVVFTPSYPAGIASIDLLKTLTPTPPSGACNCAVATGVTSGTINDQSNSTSSYTVNPLDVSDYTMTLDNEVQGAGSSHLILRQDGVFVADLSVGGGGATIGGDLAANSSVSQEVIGILNHALPGLATGYLNWTGAAWAFSAGAAGTVTGSGTANKIPRWTSGTALGNSAITDNGSNLVTVNNEQFQVNGPVMGVGPGTPALNIGQSAGNTSSACSNYNTDLTHPFPLQCISSEFSFTPDSSSTITSSWGAWVASASNAKSVSNVMASLAATNLAQGTVNESRAIHAASVNIGTTSISTGVFAETLNSSSNSQITTARALYAVNAYLNNGGTPSGATNSYGLYVDSPNISGSTSTISHQYGIYVADQTVAGTGVNSDPWGIYEAGTAPNRFGGSLTLAGLATGCLTNISGLISSTGSTCGGGGGSLPSGAQGNELANNNGTTGYAAIANTVHSASFTLPSLSTLTGGCGASPAPCVITADPNTTSAIPVATTTAIGSFTQPVTFLGGGTPLQVTATSGDGIDIYQWGALNCLGNKGPGSGTVSGCRITQGSTSTVTSIVSNGVHDGTQSDFLMRGWDIKSNPAATASVGCGVLCLVAVEGKLHVEDSSVGAYAGQIAINLQDSASNAGTNNALVFTNVFAYCNHYLNCLPLNIWGATGTGTGSGANYLFDGGAFVDSGNANPNSLTTVPLCRDGNPCLANIDGQSGGSVAQYISGVTLNTNYFETGIAMNSAGSYIEANNIRGLNVNNAVFSGGPALHNCVKISHSASGLFGYAFITGRVLANRCVDTINNSITNTVLTSASGQDIAYLYPGDNPTGGGFVVDGAQIIEGNLSLPSLTQYGIVYPSTSAGLLSTVTPPTANGNYQLVENVTGGVAVAPQFALPGIPVNPQTGTTYTYLYSDRGSRVTFSNASAIAATLPQAGSTGFTSNWTNLSCNTGAGTATITPTTSTISWTNGAAFNSAQASMPLSTGACAYLYSDNTNYSAVLLSGTVGSGTTGALGIYTASGAIGPSGFYYDASVQTGVDWVDKMNKQIAASGGGVVFVPASLAGVATTAPVLASNVTVVFGSPASFQTSHGFDVGGLFGVRLTCLGSPSPNVLGCQVKYTAATGGLFFRSVASSINGFEIDHLSLVASNAAYNGNLIDTSIAGHASTMSQVRIHDDAIIGPSSNTAACLINADDVSNLTIEGNKLLQATIGICGASTISGSNGVRVLNNTFPGPFATNPIQWGGNAWEVIGSIFEPIDGTNHHDINTNSIGMQGGKYIANWSRDGAAGTSFAATGGPVQGVEISGNTCGWSTAGTCFNFGGGSGTSQGNSLGANYINSPIGIDAGASNPGKDFTLATQYWGATVTTRINNSFVGQSSIGPVTTVCNQASFVTNTGNTTSNIVGSCDIPKGTLFPTSRLKVKVWGASCTASTAPFAGCTAINTGTCTVKVTWNTAAVNSGTALINNSVPAAVKWTADQSIANTAYNAQQLDADLVTTAVVHETPATTALDTSSGSGTDTFLVFVLANSVSGDVCGEHWTVELWP